MGDKRRHSGHDLCIICGNYAYKSRNERKPRVIDSIDFEPLTELEFLEVSVEYCVIKGLKVHNFCFSNTSSWARLLKDGSFRPDIAQLQLEFKHSGGNVLTSSVPAEQVDSLTNGVGTCEKPENPLSCTAHLAGTHVNTLLSKCTSVSEYVTMLKNLKLNEDSLTFTLMPTNILQSQSKDEQECYVELLQ